MSNMLAYPAIPEVSEADLLIISDISEDGNPTRTVSVQALVGGSTAPLALTVNGTSGAATLIDNILNIPIYTVGGGGGVNSVYATTPGTSIGTPIVVDPTTGSVLVKSMAYNGTTNVGHVPTGGSATTFLRGDGTWVVPTQTLGYTSYVQLLTQSGTNAPTGPVLDNTAGITITWAYSSSGFYTATYSTSLPDINKAAVSCSQTTKSSEGGMIVGITASSAPGFNLICKDTNGAGADSQLLGAVLEIRIYP